MTTSKTTATRKRQAGRKPKAPIKAAAPAEPVRAGATAHAAERRSTQKSRIARISVSDVVDSVPWEAWRERLGTTLATGLVSAGQWLAAKGEKLARQAKR